MKGDMRRSPEGNFNGTVSEPREIARAVQISSADFWEVGVFTRR
jgi:hypothetical protein